MTRCSVVIITYNSEGDIKRCLDSVLDQRFDGEYEIIIVDNNSQDGTRRIVRRSYPDLKLIEFEENLGVSKGYNRAFEYAIGEYVVYLNPDTIVHRDWLQNLHAVINKTKAVAAHSCVFEPYHDEFNPSNLEEYPERRSMFELNRYGFVEDIYVSPEPRETLELSACSMIIDRRFAEELDYLFDEEIPFTGEDLDLGLRLNSMGEAVVFAPHSIVYHNQNQKRNTYSPRHLLRKYISLSKGRTIALYKTMTNSEFVDFLPMLLLGNILNVRIMRLNWIWMVALYLFAIPLSILSIVVSLVAFPAFAKKRQAVLSKQDASIYEAIQRR